MSLAAVVFFLVVERVGAPPTPYDTVVDDRQASDPAPQFEPGWVSTPGNRGTLNILFSCVITLVLCVWTTVHVNIEPDNEVNDTLAGALQTFLPKRYLRWLKSEKVGRFLASRFVRKLGWGSMTVVVPEVAMAVAAYEQRTAMRLRQRINEIIKEAQLDVPEWDMYLAYYAVMGGFVISEDVYRKVAAEIKPEAEKSGSASDAHAAAAETEHAQGGDGSIANGSIVNGSIANGSIASGPIANVPQSNKALTLTPEAVLQVAEWYNGRDGPASKLLSAISSAGVQDKGNANSLAKLIIAWQGLWMIVQVLGRTIDHLPVTPLELHTALHVVCAAGMYATWWKKPLDIDTPTTIPLDYDNSYDRDKATRLIRRTADFDRTDPLMPSVPPSAGGKTPKGEPADPSERNHRIPYLTTRAGLGRLMYQRLCGHGNRFRWFVAARNAYSRLWTKHQRNLLWEALCISFAGLVYGGVHLAAWNYAFPTYTEELLWKISACVTAITWSSFVVSFWIVPWVEDLGGQHERWRALFGATCGILLVLGMIPVMFARVYMLVESFIAIRRLPKGSYNVPRLLSAWPHAG